MCLGFAWALGIFDAADPGRVFRILCDSFFATSVLLMGFGFLTAISAAGFFNIFGYSTEFIFSMIFPGMRKGKRSKDYYEYRKAKAGKKRAKWHIVIVGAFFFVCALVFLGLEAGL